MLNRAKTRVLHGTPKFFLKGKRKYFLLATDIISSEQLRKLEKIKPFGHSKAQKKNMTDIAHFPRPGQSDPYILTSLTKSYLWSCDAVRTEREETSASHFQLRKIYLKHLSSWKSDWRQSCSKIDIRWKVGKNFFSAEFNCSDHHEITIFSTDTIPNAHSLGKWDNTTADIILSWNIRTFITKNLLSSKQDSFFATTGCWRQEALTRPSTRHLLGTG